MTDMNALIASAIPIEPPDEWFEDPQLERASAIKVTPDGRVFGHVASWDTFHIGMPNGVRPPRSKSGYAYFKTGEILTASGALKPVGQLTLAGGHAGLEATASQAVKHYDDTQSAIADVAVGEDRFGIWVAGAVRPSATPEQIRALRASAPSGDWRMINGRLEMVAVCQVNVPGFPIPRALMAGGARMSLVAAGSLPLLAQVLAEQEFETRLQRLEAIAQAREERQLALVASAARARVEKARNESLTRARELALLRVRDPEAYRRATSVRAAGVSQEKRDKAAENGHALPNGAFPINTISDLKNAVHAYGRAKNKEQVKRHIIKRAHELDGVKLLPGEWVETIPDETSLAEAGDFSKLPAGFLNEKAKHQPRDTNGRFLESNSFVRWSNSVDNDKSGALYSYGQLKSAVLNANGELAVQPADGGKLVYLTPDKLEKIKAILPANQVKNQDDRGVLFKPRLHAPGAQTAAALDGDNEDDSDYGDDEPVQGDSEDFDPDQDIQQGDVVRDAVTGDVLGTVVDASNPDSVAIVDEQGDDLMRPLDALQLVDQGDNEDDDYQGDPLAEGDPVQSVADGTPLGVVTDASDPDAIEVTDPSGLTHVYAIEELEMIPDDDSDLEDGSDVESELSDPALLSDENMYN